MRNIFITGEKRIGKTTILEKVLNKLNENYDLNVGGYTCIRNIIEEKNKSSRTFYIKSLTNLKSYKIIENIVDGNNKTFNVYLESFDTYAISLKEDLQNSDLLVLDEIGPAEMDSDKYLNVLSEVLDSQKVVIGVLKKHDSELINKIRNREDVVLFEIDKINRNFIEDEIYNNLKIACDSWIKDTKEGYNF